VENQTRFWFSGFIRNPEGFFCQVGIVAVPDLIGDHPSGIKVYDDTDKILLLFETIVGHITYPYLIWSFRIEFSIYDVLTLSCLIVVPFL
jgi:hypothetical protein